MSPPDLSASTPAGGLAAGRLHRTRRQCIVMIAGCLLVLAIGMVKVGGISGLQSALEQAELKRNSVVQQTATTENVDSDNDPQPAASDWATASASRLSLMLPADTPTPFPWPGILFGLALILSPAYWIGNQAIVKDPLRAAASLKPRLRMSGEQS
ncbi:MAG UNVERIFIED_CONTAM: hypothetical protein LVR18_51145 [Planctomycetaceae bacterium]